MKIKINGIESAKRFSSLANKINTRVEIKSGRYLIDGKSIMGVFSLDLTKPLELILEDEVKYKLFKEWEVL